MQSVFSCRPACLCWRLRRVRAHLEESDTIRMEAASDAATFRRSLGSIGEPCSQVLSSGSAFGSWCKRLHA